MNRRTFTFIFLILLAAAFRFTFISWGLPNDVHPYSYHPDEAKQLYAIAKLDPFHLQLNPHEFIYPSLQYYLNAGALFIASKLGFVKLIPDITYYTTHPSDLAHMFLTGRILTALFGVATVVLVFFIGKRLYNEPAGFIAAFIMAILPTHVLNSHYMTTDVPLTFWITLTLFFSTYILKEDKWKWYVLAGFSAGLATATKYPGVFAWLLVMGAHCIRETEIVGGYDFVSHVGVKIGVGIMRLFDKKIIISGLFVLLGFFLASPYVFLDYQHSIPAIVGQWNLGSVTQFDNIAGNGIQYHYFTYLLLAAFPFMLGIPLYIFFLYSLYKNWKTGKSNTVFLGFFIIPFFLLFGTSKLVMLRYYIPFLPFFALLIASSIEENKNKLFRIGVLFVLVYTLAFSYTQLSMMNNDTQDQAFNWINQNVPTNSTIFVSPTAPYRYTPYSDPHATSSNQTNDAWIIAQRSGRNLFFDGNFNVLTMYNLSTETDEPIFGFSTQPKNIFSSLPSPDYLIVSSSDYSEYYRKQSLNVNYIMSYGFYENLRNPPNHYELIQTFDKPYLNEWLYSLLDPRFESDYASPRIEIYKAPS